MSAQESVCGVPVVQVVGTPRTMGERLGSRLRGQIQALHALVVADLSLACRPGARIGSLAELREHMRPAAVHAAFHEPSLWMEFESLAHACELPVEDLLLIHGLADLASFVGSSARLWPSTFISMTPGQTESGAGLIALVSQIDPRLATHLVLVHRIPAHGPASLSLTLSGLGPMVGLSEAHVAVARNVLRVADGVPGQLTAHLLASMLTGPSLDDARGRAQAGPRFGGGAIHALDGVGNRFSIELSGQLHVQLPDALPSAPRVHTNHAIGGELEGAVQTDADPDSVPRLNRIAGLAVNASALRPVDIVAWFGLGTDRDHVSGSTPRGLAALLDPASATDPAGTVAVVIDPISRELKIRRGTQAFASVVLGA